MGNESPYFCCGNLPSEGHTSACIGRNAEPSWCDTCESWRHTNGHCGRDECQRIDVETSESELRSALKELVNWTGNPDPIDELNLYEALAAAKTALAKATHPPQSD